MNRSFRQKTDKETLALKDILDNTDFVKYVYRTFLPKVTGYKLFSSAYETFSKIDYISATK